MPVKKKKKAGLAVVSHTGKGEDLRISLERLTEGERVAQKAAHILARREYGRRALVGMLCHTSHNHDRTKTNVTVFIAGCGGCGVSVGAGGADCGGGGAGGGAGGVSGVVGGVLWHGLSRDCRKRLLGLT